MYELWICLGTSLYGIGPTKEGAYNDYVGRAELPRDFEHCNFYKVIAQPS